METNATQTPPPVDLDAERQRLLAELLAEEGLDGVEDQPIVPRADAREAPLTFAQEVLWLLDRATPGLAFQAMAKVPKAPPIPGIYCVRAGDITNSAEELHLDLIECLIDIDGLAVTDLVHGLFQHLP